MKRLISMVLVLLIITCSCMPEPTDGFSTDADVLGVEIPVTGTDMYNADQSDILTPLPALNRFYRSNDIFEYPSLRIDLSDNNNYNIGGYLFLPFSNGSADIDMDKYNADNADEYNNLPDDVDCDEIANRFLSSLKNRDYSSLEFLTGVNYLDSQDKDSVFSFLDNIIISSYSVQRINERKNIKYYTVELDISDSDNLRYPLGKSNWILEIPQIGETAIVTLFTRTGENGFLLSPKFYSHGEDVYLDFSLELLEWYAPGNGYVTPEQFNINKLQHSTYHLMGYFNINNNYSYSLNEVNSFLKNAFGLTGLPDKSYDKWLFGEQMRKLFAENQQSSAFTCLGHGGNIYAFRHLGTKSDKNGKTKVLLALYSDFAYITLSRLIELTFEGGHNGEIPRLISVNTAYNNGNPPASLAM